MLNEDVTSTCEDTRNNKWYVIPGQDVFLCEPPAKSEITKCLLAHDVLFLVEHFPKTTQPSGTSGSRSQEQLWKSQPFPGHGPAHHGRHSRHLSGTAPTHRDSRAGVEPGGTGGRGPAGAPGRHGRHPESRDRPRLPQASPSLPPAAGRSPSRWRWWTAARRCRPAAGAMSACCRPAPAPGRAPSPQPAEPTWPRALGGGGAALPLALRGAGAARCPCGAEEGCSRKRCGTCPPVVEPPGAQRLKQQPRLYKAFQFTSPFSVTTSWIQWHCLVSGTQDWSGDINRRGNGKHHS